MTREYIIILSDKQYKALLVKSESSNNDDELNHLQNHINNWLEERDENHCEK